MSFFPAALENLIDKFAMLPGIGKKSAQRLAFFTLSLPDAEAEPSPPPSRTRSAASAAAPCART